MRIDEYEVISKLLYIMHNIVPTRSITCSNIQEEKKEKQ